MKLNKFASVTKLVVEVSSSAGVGFIIGNAVAATTPPATKALAKICINIGAASLSAMLATRVAAFTDVAIDAIFTPPAEEESADTIVVQETKGETTEKDSE